MKKKYKILAEFAKDISYETPDVETYLQTKENFIEGRYEDIDKDLK